MELCCQPYHVKREVIPCPFPAHTRAFHAIHYNMTASAFYRPANSYPYMHFIGTGSIYWFNRATSMDLSQQDYIKH